MTGDTRQALIRMGLGGMVGAILVGVVLLKANQSLTIELGNMKFLVHTYTEGLK